MIAFKGFWGWLDGALGRVYRWCGYGAAGCLVALLGLVLVSMGSRAAGVYVAGLNEYAGYFMAAGSFLALAWTLEHGGHIQVDLVLGRLAGRARLAAELWVLGVGALVCGWLAWYLGRLVYFSWMYGDRSEGADASLLWVVQLPVWFGASVLALCLVHRLVKTVARRGVLGVDGG